MSSAKNQIQPTRPLKKKKEKSLGSRPYVVVAIFVFLLSLVGSYYFWRLIVNNPTYFGVQKISIFVLWTGIIGSLLLFRILYEFAVSRDTAERKRAEEQARLLAAVLVSAKDAILVQDLDCNIKNWNRAAERMNGYTEPAAIGLTICALAYRT